MDHQRNSEKVLWLVVGAAIAAGIALLYNAIKKCKGANDTQDIATEPTDPGG